MDIPFCFLQLSALQETLQWASRSTADDRRHFLHSALSNWMLDLFTEDVSKPLRWRKALALVMLYAEFDKWNCFVDSFPSLRDITNHDKITRPRLAQFSRIAGVSKQQIINQWTKLANLFMRQVGDLRPNNKQLLLFLFALCNPFDLPENRTRDLLDEFHRTDWITSLLRLNEQSSWFEECLAEYQGLYPHDYRYIIIHLTKTVQVFKPYNVIPIELRKEKLEQLELRNRLQVFHDHLSMGSRQLLYLIAAWPETGVPATFFEVACQAKYYWRTGLQLSPLDMHCTKIIGTRETWPDQLMDLEPLVCKLETGQYTLDVSARSLIWKISSESELEWSTLVLRILLSIIPKVVSWCSHPLTRLQITLLRPFLEQLVPAYYEDIQPYSTYLMDAYLSVITIMPPEDRIQHLDMWSPLWNHDVHWRMQAAYERALVCHLTSMNGSSEFVMLEVIRSLREPRTYLQNAIHGHILALRVENVVAYNRTRLQAHQMRVDDDITTWLAQNSTASSGQEKRAYLRLLLALRQVEHYLHFVKTHIAGALDGARLADDDELLHLASCRLVGVLPDQQAEHMLRKSFLASAKFKMNTVMHRQLTVSLAEMVISAGLWTEASRLLSSAVKLVETAEDKDSRDGPLQERLVELQSRTLNDFP
ncbi:hypothetical protein KVT40_004385 [Elsinoe batatas]|uniref:Uncharacterized protein n=1 Tax=Elsinoe batatas TaxID=2601811 RepID=A0A8K0L3W2_9PEZI|nr:hypothetical protein KVT40_004385 [Elsinoe batatas]